MFSSKKKTQFRYRKRKQPKRQQRIASKNISLKLKQLSSINRVYQSLIDLQQSNRLFSSYSINELEPICQQIAFQQMSSTTTTTTSVITCPFVCLFCENLIYEPVTLCCGHTYCEQCLKNDEYSSTSVACLRCSKDIREQVQSSILHAKENNISKNHFLKQIIERSDTLKSSCENILLYQKGEFEYANKNYQTAIEIYSNILEKNKDNHLTLYGRAKAYGAIKEYDKALHDIERVVLLKPKWSKGYFCRSEILFEMHRLTSAILSSLEGLALDPDDLKGKQIMARHLHAVLHDDTQNEITPDIELRSPLSPDDKHIERKTIDKTDDKLLMCRSTQSRLCLCTLFDNKNFGTRDFECSICTNLFWFPVTTTCGHVFCRECLIRSIDNTQAQCPMCKSSLENFFPMLIHSYVNKTEIVSQIIETYFPNEFNERRHSHEQENILGNSIPSLLTNNDESIIFDVPIFVCVLTLPYCTCPLHVFEPCYRLMMRRVIENQSRTFGMCKNDMETGTFADYGTLLYVRALVYTRDGRSIVDTIGRQRFRVIERGIRDGYNTARVQIIRDHPIESNEFNNLCELNQTTYDRVRNWFNQLDSYQQTSILRLLDEYPPCDPLIQDSSDGPFWSWVMLNVLPIESELQYTALISQSFRTRLEMINKTIDFQLNHQHDIATTTSATDEL